MWRPLQFVFLVACAVPPEGSTVADVGVAPDVAVDAVDPNARSCESLTAELTFEAQAAVTCALSTDCATWGSPLCDGPAACWVAVQATSVARLDDVAAARAGACAPEPCGCGPPPDPSCVGGLCVFDTCPYECDLACPCATDAAGCAIPSCAPGTCIRADDCDALDVPDDCTGHWTCTQAVCTYMCEPACPYTCDLGCRCAVDSDGCDLPECDLSCAEPAICQDLPHAPCEGHWACEDATCVWRCDDDVCGRIAADLESARAEIGRCDELSICKAADNQLCGNVGGCYTFYRDDADFAAVRELERAYREARCYRPFCDHCAPPPEAACVRGRCAAAP